MTLVGKIQGKNHFFVRKCSNFKIGVTIRHKYQMAYCLILAPQIMNMFN